MQLRAASLSARAAEMRTRGWWPDLTLADHLDAALRVDPDKTALVDHASAEPARLSYRELDARASAIAAGLGGLGVAAGDVVAVQLPNGWPFVATAIACSRIGAVLNPLLPIYREHELEFMLNFGQARVLLVPASWRGRDHAGMVRALRPRLPQLQHLVVLGEAGAEGFDALMRKGTRAATSAPPHVQHADDISLLMFTSGTTGQPKGVLHTSNTLMSTLGAAQRELKITSDDVALCAAPLGHMLGLALLAILPMMARATMVLMESWDVQRALAIVRQEGVSFTAGATPYLADLLHAVAQGAAPAPSLRLLCCAGSPIPPVLVERAERELGLTVCSLWGMTEVQAGLITSRDAGSRFSALADGRSPPGMQVRIVDEAGQALGVGQTGRMLVRGCGVFAGYLKRPDLNAIDAEGWFDTGDLAYLANQEGYIRLNGRTKDIIKRGGVSVPVVEVESLVARHPAVAAVAIVGWPDERLGERVCAFVTLHAGQQLDLAQLQDHLRGLQLTPQYWPERLELRSELPRTASGKVQKFKLQEQVRGPLRP